MSQSAWFGRGNTAYETELNDIRRDIPYDHARRPYGPNDPDIGPRFASYDYGKPSEPRGWRKIYATMCCGSGIGLGSWLIGVVVIAAVIAIMGIKLKVSSIQSSTVK